MFLPAAVFITLLVSEGITKILRTCCMLVQLSSLYAK